MTENLAQRLNIDPQTAAKYLKVAESRNEGSKDERQRAILRFALFMRMTLLDNHVENPREVTTEEFIEVLRAKAES